MKNVYKVKKIGLLVLMLFIINSSIEAQILFNKDQIKKDFINNIEAYTKNYVKPFIKAFPYNQLNGWEQTATTVKSFGVRLGFVTSGSFVGNNNLYFYDVEGLSNKLRLKDSTITSVSNVLTGKNDKSLIYDVIGVNDQNDTINYSNEFSLFDGVTNFSKIIPYFIPQISVGLPLNIEVTMRYFPAIKFGILKHTEFGLGAKTAIIPLINKIPNFSVNIGAYYTSSKTVIDFDDIFETSDNQTISLTSKVFLVQSTGSFDFPFISIFTGLGMFYSGYSLSLNGNYKLEIDDNTIQNIEDRVVFDFNNPFTDKNKSIGIKSHIGVTFKFGIVSLSTIYSIAKYQTLNLNVAVNLFTKD